MKVIKIIERNISRCYHECPYFETEMSCMVCGHPDAPEEGYIISHPDCMKGFPKLCPLRLGKTI